VQTVSAVALRRWSGRNNESVPPWTSSYQYLKLLQESEQVTLTIKMSLHSSLAWMETSPHQDCYTEIHTRHHTHRGAKVTRVPLSMSLHEVESNDSVTPDSICDLHSSETLQNSRLVPHPVSCTNDLGWRSTIADIRTSPNTHWKAYRNQLGLWIPLL